MKKVICIDSWTQGSRHAARLVEPLARRGIQLSLLHVGSWGHEPDRPTEEVIDGLPTRDIRYYGRCGIGDILRRESPDAVLFLSIQAFAHRAFNRYCKAYGIPTMHLYHGVVNVQATTEARQYELNLRAQLAILAARAKHNAGIILPRYVASMIETRAAAGEWAWLARDVWRKLAGTSYDGLAAPDAGTDLCCVYTPADVVHAERRYGMSRDRVHVVGNPDLVAFGLGPEHVGRFDADDGGSGKIVYIDTALLDAGVAFDGPADFVEHVCEVGEAAKGQGFGFAAKLHPAHARTVVPDQLRERGIELVPTDRFVETLAAARAAIVEPSSAALIPALMGLPVLLAQFGRLARQQYGHVLVDYPNARLLRDLDRMGDALEAVRSGQDAPALQRWIDANAGPLPAADMPDRTATLLARLTQHDPD